MTSERPASGGKGRDGGCESQESSGQAVFASDHGCSIDAFAYLVFYCRANTNRKIKTSDCATLCAMLMMMRCRI